MPQVMILPNGYIVFFYSNEQYPREPVHVHIGNYDHVRIRKGDQTLIVRYKLPDNLG